MIAIDTNIIVRTIVDDDAAQVVRAKVLLAQGSLFVSTTVLLETEWVLRALYGLSRHKLADVLETFCGLDGVNVDDAEQVGRALVAYRAGADFADIMHVLECESAGISMFATFDAGMRKELRGLSKSVTIVAP